MSKGLYYACIILLIKFNGSWSQLRTNFFVKQMSICPTNGSATYSGNVTTEGKKQYLNFYLATPVPLDENVSGICIIESAVSNGTLLPLFTIRADNLCKSLNKYLGEFWYGIERAAQIPAGVCPIAAGRYRVHHHLLDFKTVSLQTFPFGTLRFTSHAFNKKNHNLVFCLIIDVVNRYNYIW